MHYRLLHPNEYLCAADLHGKDVTLTISALKQEVLRTEGGDEDRWVMYFKEMEGRPEKEKKRLVLNKTNATTISHLHGKETDGWIGKPITMYPTNTKAFGEIVECIRVRDRVKARPV